jgi:glycosyltransferase involved in cell wall biosynthesis
VRERSTAASSDREHLLIAMPYAPGFGMAWNYIERLTRDLSRSLGARGSRCTIAHPTASGEAGADAGVHRVARMFYRTSPGQTVANALWLRKTGVTHLYFAEHTAFDWRFAVYRALAGVRIIVHYHHGGGRDRPYTGVTRALRRVRAAVLPILADRAICVSEFIRNRIVTVALVPPQRCVTIRNAAVPEKTISAAARTERRRVFRDSLHIPDATVVVLCGARAAREKGVDVLFTAFDAMCTELEQRSVPLPLLIHAGSGPDFEELDALRRSLPHAARMQMLGRVPDIEDALSAADVAVLPSRYDDAFPLFAIEAMQGGVPAVVTSRGGLPEIVQDGVEGFVIPDEDAAALANRLRMLVLAPELRTRMGAAGLAAIVQRFSYPTMLATLESSIMGRHPDRSPVMPGDAACIGRPT